MLVALLIGKPETTFPEALSMLVALLIGEPETTFPEALWRQLTARTNTRIQSRGSSHPCARVSDLIALQLMTRQRLPMSNANGQSAVTRLAWIAEDSAALMLLRLPLLQAVVQRRHKVLALAPGLTPAHRLTLLAQGIESATLPVRAGPLGPFSRHRARSRLASILSEWRANTAIIECDELMDFALRGCLSAQVRTIHPVMPMLEPQTAATLASRRWARLVGPATTAFAATANDARMAAATLGAAAPSMRPLPPVTVDFATLAAEPLPPIENGIVFLGVSDGAHRKTPSPYMAAAQLVRARAARSQFQLAFVGAPSTPPVSDSFSRFDLDPADGLEVRAAVTAAHVVVIEQPSAAHLAVLAMALAVGRPVLAVNAPFAYDLIDAGVDGWHADGDQASELADAMVAILKRPDLLAGMARAARQKARRRLDRADAEAELFAALGLADLGVRAA